MENGGFELNEVSVTRLKGVVKNNTSTCEAVCAEFSVREAALKYWAS